MERFLRHEYVPGMAESALFFRYMMFGRDPFIAERPESSDASAGFSAWDYAKAALQRDLSRHAQGAWQPTPAERVSDIARLCALAVSSSSITPAPRGQDENAGVPAARCR